MLLVWGLCYLSRPLLLDLDLEVEHENVWSLLPSSRPVIFSLASVSLTLEYLAKY